MEILIIILITIIGLIFGSFFACMGYRIPNKIKNEKRSFCPNCKNKLKWYMNIPVLSFIFLQKSIKNTVIASTIPTHIK